MREGGKGGWVKKDEARPSYNHSHCAQPTTQKSLQSAWAIRAIGAKNDSKEMGRLAAMIPMACPDGAGMRWETQ